jgi:hypothetical protein
VDGDVLSQAVVDLVESACASQCLVWAKADAIVRLLKELRPALRVGFVVINETVAARNAGMDNYLRVPEAEVIALHYGMAGVAPEAERAGKQVHGAVHEAVLGVCMCMLFSSAAMREHRLPRLILVAANTCRCTSLRRTRQE